MPKNLNKAIDTINGLNKDPKPTSKKNKKKEPSTDTDSDIEELSLDSFKVKKAESEITYKKLELHSQILLRPDTYIGSILPTPSSSYVFDNDSIIKKTITFPDGLLRIFIEIVSNAVDNVWNSLRFNITPKFIKINFNEDGSISVWNDGRNIPTKLNDDGSSRIPDMIFGQLLTSSNYNDNEERKTSGKNGLGVKCSNLFSKKFSIEIYNKEEGVFYTQNWYNNMYDREEPTIINTKSKTNKTFTIPKTPEDGKNGYTKVTFFPDYERFSLKGITDDILSLFTKIAYDTAMTVSLNKVEVILNGELIKIKNIADYVKLYFNNELPEEHLLFSSDDSRVVIVANNEFEHISFVNGIITVDGGNHVDSWCEEIFRPIVNKINEKRKDKKISINDIKRHFFIFVYADLDKPTFTSQSKTKLTGPPVKTSQRKNDTSKLMKWSFIKKIEDSLKSKDLISLKGEVERKRGQVKVDGLDDANFAGQKDKDCILCVSEGLSAATYINQGMKYGFFEKKGHDYIGVLPIRGKFLNVRNSSQKTLIENKEVKALIQSLGLQAGVDYTDIANFKKLRYSKLLVCCDSDSVTGDTPLLLRKNGLIQIQSIDSIAEEQWVSDTDLLTDKEYNKTSFEVWTEDGWTKIKHIMRHKTTKKMFRVLTHTGVVDVTEDHSLLTEDKEKISPNDIQVGNTLLHSFPDFEENRLDIPDNLECLTIDKLRKLSSVCRIKHYKYMNKEEMIKLIKVIKNKNYETINYFSKFIEDDLATVMGFFFLYGSCKRYGWIVIG